MFIFFRGFFPWIFHVHYPHVPSYSGVVELYEPYARDLVDVGVTGTEGNAARVRHEVVWLLFTWFFFFRPHGMTQDGQVCRQPKHFGTMVK